MEICRFGEIKNELSLSQMVDFFPSGSVGVRRSRTRLSLHFLQFWSDFACRQKPLKGLIKSHFSGISHAQTPAMATRINLLLFDLVSRSSKYPLLRNNDKYSNIENPLSLAYNEFGDGYRGSSRRLTSRVQIRCKRSSKDFQYSNIYRCFSAMDIC